MTCLWSEKVPSVPFQLVKVFTGDQGTSVRLGNKEARALLCLGPRAAGGSEALRTPFDYSTILGSEAFFYYFENQENNFNQEV